jgi:hypothetical protein
VPDCQEDKKLKLLREIRSIMDAHTNLYRQQKEALEKLRHELARMNTAIAAMLGASPPA